MTSSNGVRSVSDLVHDALANLLAELEMSAQRMKVIRPGILGEIDFEIVPPDQQRARVFASVVGSDIEVFLGQGTRTFFSVKERDPASSIRQFTLYCRAVLKGQFIETIWVRGQKVDGAIGQVETPEGIMRLRTNVLPGLMWRAKKRTIRYGRYPTDRSLS